MLEGIEKEVREALIKRATGYDYEERKIIADKNGKPQKVEVYKKHLPPDLVAINTLMREFRSDKR